MAKAPFRVYFSSGTWWLYGRVQKRHLAYFDTPGEAIDHAYKHWPWWP